MFFSIEGTARCTPQTVILYIVVTHHRRLYECDLVITPFPLNGVVSWGEVDRPLMQALMQETD